MTILAFILAFVWGGVWAAFLQWTKIGQYLAFKRTWITVVVGVGIDLLIMLLILPLKYWILVASVICFSSVLIIVRSILLETNEHQEILNVYTHQVGKQNDLGVRGSDSDL